MKSISIHNSKTGPLNLAFDDQGSGPPVVFLHPWPLSKKSWERQLSFFGEAGFRAIAIDRRGFGESSKGLAEYDYDSLTGDIEAFLEALDLQEVTLVGLSMGGGELARYLGKYGSSRIARAVFIASVPPRFINGDSRSRYGLREMQARLLENRSEFMQSQLRRFFATSKASIETENEGFVVQALEE